MNKKLPPYGKELKKKFAAGIKPHNDIFLFIGERAWNKCQYFINQQNVLVLPPHDSPYNYKWPVAGCQLLGFATSKLHVNYIEMCAHALLMANASIVRFILEHDHSLVIYRRNTT